MQGDFCAAGDSQLPIRAGDHNPVAAYRRGTHGLWTGPVPNGVLMSDCVSETDYQTECLDGTASGAEAGTHKLPLLAR